MKGFITDKDRYGVIIKLDHDYLAKGTNAPCFKSRL